MSLTTQSASVPVVEENRLSSFTEKSTRYQVMSAENYYTPPAFESGRLGELYRETIERASQPFATIPTFGGA